MTEPKVKELNILVLGYNQEVKIVFFKNKNLYNN